MHATAPVEEAPSGTAPESATERPCTTAVITAYLERRDDRRHSGKIDAEFVGLLPIIASRGIVIMSVTALLSTTSAESVWVRTDSYCDISLNALDADSHSLTHTSITPCFVYFALTEMPFGNPGVNVSCTGNLKTKN